MPELESIFFLPLSQQAYAELQDLITTCKALISTLMSRTHGLTFGVLSNILQGNSMLWHSNILPPTFKHLASNL